MKGFESLTVLRRAAFAAIPLTAGSATASGMKPGQRWVRIDDSR